MHSRWPYMVLLHIPFRLFKNLLLCRAAGLTWLFYTAPFGFFYEPPPMQNCWPYMALLHSPFRLFYEPPTIQSCWPYMSLLHSPFRLFYEPPTIQNCWPYMALLHSPFRLFYEPPTIQSCWPYMSLLHSPFRLFKNLLCTAAGLTWFFCTSPFGFLRTSFYAELLALHGSFTQPLSAFFMNLLLCRTAGLTWLFYTAPFGFFMNLLLYRAAGHTCLFYTAPFGFLKNLLLCSNSSHSLNLSRPYLVLAVTAASHNPCTHPVNQTATFSLVYFSSCSPVSPIFQLLILRAEYLKVFRVTTLFFSVHLLWFS